MSQRTGENLKFKELPPQGVGLESEIYARRFGSKELRARELTWSILCEEFFQKYISPWETVLDVGAGDGFFLKSIEARKKIAVDLSPHARELEKHDIEVFQIPATELSKHIREKVDVVLMSNFLEHLPEKRLVLTVLEECRKILKTGGRLLILQPNIRYTGVAYWDYIDHHIALTEHSLREALDVTGFEIVQLIPRFLPYTANSTSGRLAGGRFGFLIRIYLRYPILWRFFGQQTFVVGQSRLDASANERER